MAELGYKHSQIYLTLKSVFSITAYCLLWDTKQYDHLRTNVYNPNLKHLYNILRLTERRKIRYNLKYTTLNLVSISNNLNIFLSFPKAVSTNSVASSTLSWSKLFCAEPEMNNGRFSSMRHIPLYQQSECFESRNDDKTCNWETVGVVSFNTFD